MFSQVPQKFVFPGGLPVPDTDTDPPHMAPINQLTTEFWDKIFENGFIDNQVAIEFKDIFVTSGVHWFVTRIVKVFT